MEKMPWSEAHAYLVRRLDSARTRATTAPTPICRDANKDAARAIAAALERIDQLSTCVGRLLADAEQRFLSDPTPETAARIAEAEALLTKHPLP